MTEYRTTLKPRYIHAIQDGSKTVEGRINSGIFASIQVGDGIIFFGRENHITLEVSCEVVSRREYKSFIAMLQGEGVGSMLPKIDNVESGVAIYNKIPGYPDRARRRGVVALGLKVRR